MIWSLRELSWIITESRLTSPQQVQYILPDWSVCLAGFRCEVSNLVRFVLTRDRNACHSGTETPETPETPETVPVEISGDQWRHYTVAPCCVLRVLWQSVWTWSQEAWTIRTGEFVTKSGRYGTHLDAFGRIWYERKNQKIIPFHRCETETVPVLFDLQEETVDICWLARCHSVTVSQCCTSSSCASIPLRQHSWQQHRPWLTRRLRCGQSQYVKIIDGLHQPIDSPNIQLLRILVHFVATFATNCWLMLIALFMIRCNHKAESIAWALWFPKLDVDWMSIYNVDKLVEAPRIGGITVSYRITPN